MAFKMKGPSLYKNSPMKQDSKKTFERIQKMKSKAKKFVKNLKIKNIANTAKKGNILSIMLGATKTATADQPKFPKGSAHYMDDKKKIKFGK